MNKFRLVWGVICLALAGLAVALNFLLPPEYPTFMIGGQSMLWIPVIVLCIVGCVLLVTTASRLPATTETKLVPGRDLEKATLNKRLEGIAWGLFLIMLGGFMFVPASRVPQGLWSIGIGVIMLGLNATRYLFKIRMSGFTTFLGILSLLGGIAELIGVTSLQGALLLIVLGALLILKPWIDKRQLFGKAEESRL
ncbi:MAG: hypothetical protein EHM41_03080 [Chloroflexi bacterium]|nr:MAG: hypothetical protein EHM41_03080 [Chloroflexota bacterium]